jgi:hypothetical protein
VLSLLNYFSKDIIWLQIIHKSLVTILVTSRRIFNVTPYLDKKAFTALNDTSVFQSVRVNFDSIEWSNGADFDPEMLYAESALEDQGIAICL